MCPIVLSLLEERESTFESDDLDSERGDHGGTEGTMACETGDRCQGEHDQYRGVEDGADMSVISAMVSTIDIEE